MPSLPNRESENERVSQHVAKEGARGVLSGVDYGKEKVERDAVMQQVIRPAWIELEYSDWNRTRCGTYRRLSPVEKERESKD